MAHTAVAALYCPGSTQEGICKQVDISMTPGNVYIQKPSCHNNLALVQQVERVKKPFPAISITQCCKAAKAAWLTCTDGAVQASKWHEVTFRLRGISNCTRFGERSCSSPVARHCSVCGATQSSSCSYFNSYT